RRLELPRLARADGVERELDVLAQLGGRLRAAGLVVDQLVAALGQPVDAVHAAAQHVRAELALERALEPDGLPAPPAEGVVVPPQPLRALPPQLALLLGAAEAAAAPARLQQAEQLRQP